MVEDIYVMWSDDRHHIRKFDFKPFDGGVLYSATPAEARGFGEGTKDGASVEARELTRPIIGIEIRTPLEVFDIMCDRIKGSLSRPTAAPDGAIPAGMALVPREPTREMWAAGGDAVVGYKQRHHDKVVEDVWSAMLAAALAPADAEGR